MTTKVVAEIGLSHEGSLGTALRMIDACAVMGADAVKFQNHTGDKVNRFREGTDFPQDDDRQAYWHRTAFQRRDWKKIRAHCAEMGVEFGVSCFSFEAFCEMADVGVDFWKVGSAQVASLELLQRMEATGLPLVLSSGMSTFCELAAALTVVTADRVTLLQCVSAYPASPEQIGLNVMAELRTRFHCDVGLSDHSGTIVPGIIAAYLGATMLEVHVCLSKWAFGPDVKASLDVDELGRLVAGIRFVEQMEHIDKDAAAEGMEEMRRMFRA